MNFYNKFKVNTFIALALILGSCTRGELPSSNSSSLSSLMVFTITFDTKGGTSIDPITQDFNTSLTPPFNPTRIGYVFAGWFSDEALTKYYIFPSTMPEVNITLFAKWMIKQFTITFDTKGGTTIYPITQDFNTSLTPPFNPTRIGYVFAGWFSDEALTKQYIFPSTMPAANIKVYASWNFQIFKAPILIINLDNNIEINEVNREYYLTAKSSIILSNFDYDLSEVSTEIRGRGNASWGYSQKGYKLKFDKAVSILGKPSNKHWVLVPSGHDFSSLRNHYAYKIANEVFDGIEYSSSVNPIEVYFNHKYHGFYHIFEHVRIGSSRVNITSDYGIDDTGYLLEYDSYASGVEGIDYFVVDKMKYRFDIKSPNPEDFSSLMSENEFRNQVEYIKNYIQYFVDAVYDDDLELLNELADLNSLVDMYLLYELFKNVDAGWSSFFLYKKANGKLYFGPPWDFDFSSGISRGDQGYKGLYVGDSVLMYSNLTSNELFIKLMKNENFVGIVKKRYQFIFSGLIDQINSIFIYTQHYSESFERDSMIWTWKSDWFLEQNNLYDWLVNRANWLYEWSSL
jgi:uncharacterized repeat protein (TIGR02543 family)